MTKWLIYSLFLLCASGVSANESIDLQGAIDLAAQNSPSMVALQREKEAAEAEVRIESQFSNPSLIGEITRSEPNYFVGAGYTFELGGKRSKRIEVAKGAVEVAGLNYRIALQALRHDVRIAFYTLLTARKKEFEVGQSRDLAQKLFEIAKERFEVGDVARLEVLQASLELKRRENDLKQANSETQAALVQLNALFHRDPHTPIDLKDSDTAPPVPDLETLTSRATAGHYNLLSIRQQRKTEEAKLALAKAGRIPDLDMEGGTEIHDQGFQYGYRAAMRMDLPILNRKQGEILLANTNIERLNAEEEAATIKLQADISAAFLRYQTALTRAQDYETDILPVSRDIEQLAVESYQSGKSGILSVIDAQRSIRDVRLEYLDVELQFQTALADLEQTAGVELK